MNLGNLKHQHPEPPDSEAADQEANHEDADEMYRRSIDVFRELVRDYPEIPRYRGRLASVLGMRAWFHDDHQLSVRLNDEALRVLNDLVEDYPTISEYRRNYGAMLSNAAEQSLAHDLTRAENLARQAIQQQLRSLEANPEHPKSMEFLATHYFVLANILRRQGRDPAGVIDACNAGLEMGERLHRRYPENESIAHLVRTLHKWEREAQRLLPAKEAAESDNRLDSSSSEPWPVSVPPKDYDAKNAYREIDLFQIRKAGR